MKEYFIKLSQDYPLAYKEMEGWDRCTETLDYVIPYMICTDTDHRIKHPSSIRDLYDWFDPLLIDIFICKTQFAIFVGDSNKNVCNVITEFRDEKKAFTKAFEIREEQLKAKQK